MNKWYLVSGHEDPDTREVLLEVVDGNVYERYVVNQSGKSWKVTTDVLFHHGWNVERLERYRNMHPNVTVKEINEEDVFAIML